MNFFSGVLLLVSHDPQNRCQDHPRTMDPLQIPVQSYGPLRETLHKFCDCCLMA